MKIVSKMLNKLQFRSTRIVVMVITFTILYTLINFLIVVNTTQNRILELEKKLTSIFSTAIGKSILNQMLFSDPAIFQGLISSLIDKENIVFAYIKNEKGEYLVHTFSPIIPKEIMELDHSQKNFQLDTTTYGHVLITSIPLYFGKLGYLVIGQKLPKLTSLWIKIGISTLVLLVLYILSFKFFIGKQIEGPIARAISTLTNSSTHIAATAPKVTSFSQQIAQDADMQASSIENASAALEEILSIAKQNVDKSKDANQFMLQANEFVSKVKIMIQGMANAMKAIGKSGQKIEDIIRTIDDIASQTNLLALNAAVEAARVGKEGAGFSIVADEIRNLSVKSAESAKNTQILIREIVDEINNGESVALQTGSAFDEVVQSTDEIGKLIHEITFSSEEQSRGIEEIEQAISQLDSLAQHHVELSKETVNNAQEVTSQASSLSHVVAELNGLIGKSEETPIQPVEESSSNVPVLD